MIDLNDMSNLDDWLEGYVKFDTFITIVLFVLNLRS